MAAVNATPRVVVRAAAPGEGHAIARLWRQLWEAHERWGGYASARDDRVYARLAQRLEEDARVRAGQPVLGRHVHLIAIVHGEVAGQVEGWFERHGHDLQTPFTCEVRSLIVDENARARGIGRSLLDALARTSRDLARGATSVLAAEVLEPNPAHPFYAKVGYRPVAWSLRIESARDPRIADMLSARIAEPRDALAIAVLDSTLASRRRMAGDLRFDRPRAIEATLVGAISAHLGRKQREPNEPVEIVALDRTGEVRASATFAVSPLDPPFVPTRRAILGRFAVDPAQPAAPLVFPLLAQACRMARIAGAPTIEITDMTAPGTPLYEAAAAAGARPWSRIVTRLFPGERSA